MIPYIIMTAIFGVALGSMFRARQAIRIVKAPIEPVRTFVTTRRNRDGVAGWKLVIRHCDERKDFVLYLTQSEFVAAIGRDEVN